MGDRIIMPNGALSGYNVVDLTHYIAGPYCTKLLAGCGAEVIKIEKPGTGDRSRGFGPFVGDEPDIEKSQLFLFLNTGKKSITLNLKTPTGVDIFNRLVKEADILVESFEPRVMPSLGLGYDTLCEINPRLVMTSISNFGQSGPYRDYKASEIVEYALSGLMKITGESDRPPLKLGLDVAQLTAGQSAMPPTLAALYSANLTGKGQYVDISTMDYCTGLLEFQIGQHVATGHIPPRRGNLNEKGHPHGPFPCRDGYVAFTIAYGNPEVLVEMTGIPEFNDPKFATNYERLQHRDEFDTLMLPWLIEHDKKDIFPFLCLKKGCASAAVRNVEEIVNCPQLKSQEFYVEVEHPSAGKVIYPSGVAKMSETPWQIGRAPLLGEHNEEIYCSRLGYNQRNLAELKETGII